MAIIIKADNFEQEVIKSKIPVLVDFWAQWCGPCQMLAPVIEEITKEYEGKIKVCKLDVDQSPDIASRFGVMSIPTLIVFSKGKNAVQSVGSIPKDKIIDLIEPYIGE